MRITKDDDRARRICSLAIAFMNASAPLPSSEVARRFYPELSADSFRRAFSRDRALLAACGIRVCEGPRGSEASWVADRGASFAGDVELEQSDAAVLEIACQPLLEDPEFPLSGDLRFALAKLTRTFAYSAPAASNGTREETRVETAVRDAVTRKRALAVTYTDAAGRSSERRLAPYGLFGLRGATYLVAARLNSPGDVSGDPRTYRLDRMSVAEVLEGVAIDVPENFSAAAWRRLPFQMGRDPQTATFEIPPARRDDMRRAAGGRGMFFDEDGSLFWEVEVSDVSSAASWAVAQGIVPVGPPELVRARRDLLRGAAGNAE